jgi:gamma-glutamylcyclotransferase (GGCT)/AIG2-like uncharacterized protein YtfP
VTQTGQLLLMFFYGTLKRGQSNHERFCSEYLHVEPATTPGHLYELPFGFPGLRVDAANVRAVGTWEYLADAEKQIGGAAPLSSGSGWDLVHGELFTFEDPEQRLIAFDALEGYTPGESSLYQRVLIPVQSASGRTLLAWAYELKRPTGAYLPGGRWPA